MTEFLFFRHQKVIRRDAPSRFLERGAPKFGDVVSAKSSNYFFNRTVYRSLSPQARQE